MQTKVKVHVKNKLQLQAAMLSSSTFQGVSKGEKKPRKISKERHNQIMRILIAPNKHKKI